MKREVMCYGKGETQSKHEKKVCQRTLVWNGNTHPQIQRGRKRKKRDQGANAMMERLKTEIKNAGRE